MKPGAFVVEVKEDRLVRYCKVLLGSGMHKADGEIVWACGVT